jgi:hypothetical protein
MRTFYEYFIVFLIIVSARNIPRTNFHETTAATPGPTLNSKLLFKYSPFHSSLPHVLGQWLSPYLDFFQTQAMSVEQGDRIGRLFTLGSF